MYLLRIFMKFSKISNIRNFKQARIRDIRVKKIIICDLQNSLPQLESNDVLHSVFFFKTLLCSLTLEKKDQFKESVVYESSNQS